MTTSLKRGTGMVLGKFLPPHLGHLYLIDFAKHYCEELTVLVCSIEREPIPGVLRFEWMKRLCPDVRLVHVTDEVPQEPSEHPEFWPIWQELIRRHIPEGPDYVFASEPYGATLAEVLGASFVPVDIARELVPVSGTAVRDDPMTHWAYIPDVVRPYFVRRVCLFGPESTGKTTLTKELAAHYQTVAVHEYARPLLEPKMGVCDYDDIERIARGQRAAEEALARQANRVMFCDTDLLTTTIWSDVLFGRCPQGILDEAERRSYDLYLLMDIDIPWVDDAQRYLPHEREAFMGRCREALARRNRPYVLISGSFEERFERARAAVDRLLMEARGPGEAHSGRE
jgi:HTH-type transcriptional regulator, transcriptional repressor of NAD biosynthesis genes